MPEKRDDVDGRSRPVLDHLGIPIVLAPMAGGPPTPALARLLHLVDLGGHNKNRSFTLDAPAFRLTGAGGWDGGRMM